LAALQLTVVVLVQCTLTPVASFLAKWQYPFEEGSKKFLNVKNFIELSITSAMQLCASKM
jgi:hypothetical protein